MNDPVITPNTDKRALILDGAERVFVARGFAAARVEDIAEEAGVAKGTIYLYFASKQEVFVSLIEVRAQELVLSLQNQLFEIQSAALVLKSLVRIKVEFYLKHLGLIDQAFQWAPQLEQELQARLIVSRSSIAEASTHHLSKFIPAAFPVSMLVVTGVIDGAVNGIVLNAIEAQEVIDAEKIAEDVVFLLLPGMLQR